MILVTSSALANLRVVGLGSIGRQYLASVAEGAKGLRIAVSATGLKSDAHEGIEATYESFEAAERPHVDLCVIATRTGRHVEDALTFGATSRRMLIEKPIAPRLEDATLLIQERALLPEFVSVASPLRFMSGFSEVKRLLPRIGSINAVHIVCESWLPDWRPHSDYRSGYSASASEGGVLLDLVHEVDYALELFGPPEGVSATLSREPALGIPVEAHASVNWRYPAFALTMSLSFGRRESRRNLKVEGSQATLEWDLLTGSVTALSSVGDVESISSFPTDLSRPTLLWRQLEASLGAESVQAPATLGDGLLALHLVDLAKQSHAVDSREVELSKSAYFA